MKIQEFVRGRAISSDTVRKYIKRNPELFKGHIGRSNNIILDDVAVELLEQKYPLPTTPIQVIQDTAAMEKLQLLQEKYIELIEENKRLTQDNANLMLQHHKQALLEKDVESTKDCIIEETRRLQSRDGETKYRLEKITGTEDYDLSEKSLDQVFNAYQQRVHDRVREKDQLITELQQQLAAERQKTWWDKLRGR